MRNSRIEDRELLISKYIDNELDLDEKIEFVKILKKDDELYRESIEMLESEKLVSFEIPYNNSFHIENRHTSKTFYKQIGMIAAVLLVIFSFVLGFYSGKVNKGNKKVISKNEIVYRFVYYDPSAKSVALIGSFTGWKKIYLKKVGSGYWQAYVKLSPNGFYKYNFVVNDKKVIYDPSNPAKIYNGFGGFDSVIKA
ncbi:glycogen-binding domain-containing protein [Hippea alviniae]|uniref:glycogen-binding domain-containing protein n=1 Tax=Hippea alviniae TaxID=1279027 RepID=UPI0003B4D5B8|nr:glycogen-binding domain-containing protein [Hippea alviniae]